MTSPWDIVNEPIHYIPAPRPRSKSIRALLLLSGLIVIGLVLWGVN